MEQRELFYLEYKGLYFASMYTTVIHNLSYLTYELDNILGKDNYKLHTSPINIPDLVEYVSPLKSYDYFHKFHDILDIHNSLSILLQDNIPNKKQFEDYCKELNDNHMIRLSICTEKISQIIYLPYDYSTADFISIHSLLSKTITFRKTLYTSFLSEILGSNINENTDACLSIGEERISIRIVKKLVSNG